MEHIAQVNIDPATWVQYQSWFWIRHYGPKDYSYSDGVLLLKSSGVINEFHSHHPNLNYSVVKHPTIS